jgi:CO dehydrogenase/acetyl-CoA synthase gamma subunit (corrinoid Fe-S protein)
LLYAATKANADKMAALALRRVARLAVKAASWTKPRRFAPSLLKPAYKDLVIDSGARE